MSHLKFEIASGQVTALMGCSGSGKSTLLLALAGIVPEFYSGEWLSSLRVGEVTVTDDPRTCRVCLMRSSSGMYNPSSVVSPETTEVAIGISSGWRSASIVLTWGKFGSSLLCPN